MKRCLLLGFSVALVWLLGCPNTYLRTQMRITPAGLVWQTDSYTSGQSETVPASQVATAPVEPDQIVSGAFKSDFNGRGQFIRIRTQMGTAYLYAEGFAGQADLGWVVQKRLQAADQFSALVRGWLMKHLQGAQGSAKLQKWLETDFPADVRSLSMYGWALSAAQSLQPDSAQQLQIQCYFRAGQYLLERGYFDADDLLDVLDTLDNRKDDGEELTIRLLAQLLARRMGYATTQPVAKQLAFLGDGNRLWDSFIDYACTSESFKKWRKENKATIASTSPSSSERDHVSDSVLTLVIQAFDWGAWVQSFFQQVGNNQVAEATLAVRQPPVYTNGTVSAEDNAVRWSMTLPSIDRNDRMPLYRYAVGVEVDERFQKAHFGKVVLADGLAGYCLWHHRLNPWQAKQWDEFVATLRPGPDLEAKLAGFEFSSPASRPGDRIIQTPEGKRLLLSDSQEAITQPTSMPAAKD